MTTERTQPGRTAEPVSLRRRLASVVRLLRDAAEVEVAARAGVVPPQRMWPLVGGDAPFVAQGRSFFDYLVEHGGVRPDGAVLDIGCGLGKHALHFADYLRPPGRYEGFDVEPVRVRWCRRAITRRHPHVRFQLLPIRNARYSPEATAEAREATFPYADGVFDLAFLASVFTHMFDGDIARYAAEIARVLKPGGVCIATLYLLNDERRAALASGRAAFSFGIGHQGSWIETPDPPEAAVAQDEARVLALFAAVGLTPREPIRYGVWDRSAEQDQDFVVFGKSGAAGG